MKGIEKILEARLCDWGSHHSAAPAQPSGLLKEHPGSGRAFVAPTSESRGLVTATDL